MSATIPSRIKAELVEYKLVRNSILSYRSATFPTDTNVIVNDPGRYRGPGIASNDSSVPADKCAVTLSNGNTWWYYLLNVSPAATPKKDARK